MAAVSRCTQRMGRREPGAQRGGTSDCRCHLLVHTKPGEEQDKSARAVVHVVADEVRLVVLSDEKPEGHRKQDEGHSPDSSPEARFLSAHDSKHQDDKHHSDMLLLPPAVVADEIDVRQIWVVPRMLPEHIPQYVDQSPDHGPGPLEVHE